MQTDQDVTNDDTQDIDPQLAKLLDEAKKIKEETEDAGKKTQKEMDEIGANADKNVENLNNIFVDLDQAEKEADDELAKIDLRQKEDLT